MRIESKVYKGVTFNPHPCKSDPRWSRITLIQKYPDASEREYCPYCEAWVSCIQKNCPECKNKLNVLNTELETI
jgi:hypothetical protein